MKYGCVRLSVSKGFDEIFDPILAPLRLNFRLVPVDYLRALSLPENPKRKTSDGVKSGGLSGQFTSPLREIAQEISSAITA